MCEQVDAAGGGTCVVAQRLDHLIGIVHGRGRGPMSEEEIAEQMGRERTGAGSSAADIRRMREGLDRRHDPAHLDALAAFFGVKPAYFVDAEVAARTDEQLEVIAMMRDRGIRGISCLPENATLDTVKAYLAMMDDAVPVEQIPTPAADDSPDRP
jgi:transcriptional regulator with XRE-family HTH domain